MNNKSGINLTELFSDAAEVQDVLELESKVFELTQEIARLRENGQDSSQNINQLKEMLVSSPIREIELELIDRNPNQPRRTFLEDTISHLADSLERDGQQEPVILIDKGECFELFDGERRYRAATKLGWNTIKAIVIPRPAHLQRKILVASLHREGLNQLDMAEAVLQEIQTATGMEAETIVRLIRTTIRRFARHQRIPELLSLSALQNIKTTTDEHKERGRPKLEGISDEERKIFTVLLELGIKPPSFAVAVDCLNLFDDLKVAIREQGLSVNTATALSKLTPQNLGCTPKAALKVRRELIERIINDRLSLSKVRQLVNQKLKKPSDRQENKVIQAIDRIEVAKLSESSRQELKEALRRKLQELD
jgi:ParB family chromosome partitioning protein